LIVIASKAKQYRKPKIKDWIASSLKLLATTSETSDRVQVEMTL